MGGLYKSLQEYANRYSPALDSLNRRFYDAIQERERQWQQGSTRNATGLHRLPRPPRLTLSDHDRIRSQMGLPDVDIHRVQGTCRLSDNYFSVRGGVPTVTIAADNDNLYSLSHELGHAKDHAHMGGQGIRRMVQADIDSVGYAKFRSDMDARLKSPSGSLATAFKNGLRLAGGYGRIQQARRMIADNEASASNHALEYIALQHPDKLQSAHDYLSMAYGTYDPLREGRGIKPLSSYGAYANGSNSAAGHKAMHSSSIPQTAGMGKATSAMMHGLGRSAAVSGMTKSNPNPSSWRGQSTAQGNKHNPGTTRSVSGGVRTTTTNPNPASWRPGRM